MCSPLSLGSWIYINRSEALVQAAHPGWPAARVVSQAEADFNAAARAFWTESIRLCKKLRPHGLWGWYNYPVDSWSSHFPWSLPSPSHRLW